MFWFLKKVKLKVKVKIGYSLKKIVTIMEKNHKKSSLFSYDAL